MPAAFAQSAPVTTPSGLIYQSIKEGTGASPAATDVVKVHYRGTFPDTGKEFDSSYKRGEPTEFPLNGVIPCWTEGVQKMKPGGKAKLTCPPSIAYGLARRGRRDSAQRHAEFRSGAGVRHQALIVRSAPCRRRRTTRRR